MLPKGPKSVIYQIWGTQAVGVMEYLVSQQSLSGYSFDLLKGCEEVTSEVWQRIFEPVETVMQEQIQQQIQEQIDEE